MKKTPKNKFDVGIIGSGIAGSILATVLARQGLSVVIFEAQSHPKFAIGESLILETSETLRAIAELYDVPEIAYFSSENFFPKIGTTHGVKRHFSYAYHRPGANFKPNEVLQAVIPRHPYGHELHIYRQDSDYFYSALATKYGATVLQNTAVSDFNITDSGVTLTTKDNHSFETDYIVDSSGFRSLVAQKYKLRKFDLKSHSRAIFTHMIDVPSFHSVSKSREKMKLPYSLSEGTLHHLFNGGWLWVIPFNNHPISTNPFCSVGLMLDPRVHPKDDSISAEEEFYKHVKQFPSIDRQLKEGKAVRTWTRTNRIQYTSKKVVGDRYCLLGHSAGFIDPLFSKGLYASLSCVCDLAQRLIKAKSTQDYSAKSFKPFEERTLNFINSNDELISKAYQSFADHSLWHTFSVLWLTGAYLEVEKLVCARLLNQRKNKSKKPYFSSTNPLKLVGGGFNEFDELSKQIYALMDKTNLNDKASIKNTVNKMIDLFDNTEWIPFAFKDIAHGKNYLPKNKFHPRLFKSKGGLMGRKSYKNHFFTDITIKDLVWFVLKENAKYSLGSIRKRHKKSLQL